MTQNQLTELIESDQGRALLETAEERGYVEPTELEAFALEHDLADDDVEAFARELEAMGVELGPRAEGDAEPSQGRSSTSSLTRSPERQTACSCSSPTSASTSC